MTFRPLPVLTLLSLVSVIILILLGNWQYARYSEKIDQPTTEEAAAVASELSFEIKTDDTWSAALVYGVIDGEPVWRRYVPARLLNDNTPAMVLWDATGGPEPVTLQKSDLSNPSYIRIGNLFVRESTRGQFGFQNQPENGIWYTFNGLEMATYLGLEQVEPIPVFETVEMTIRNADNLDQTRETNNPYAFETPIDPLPAERHFGYALTWWGMALGLIGVYVVFHHSRGRLRFRS